MNIPIEMQIKPFSITKRWSTQFVCIDITILKSQYIVMIVKTIWVGLKIHFTIKDVI